MRSLSVKQSESVTVRGSRWNGLRVAAAVSTGWRPVLVRKNVRSWAVSPHPCLNQLPVRSAVRPVISMCQRIALKRHT